MLLIRGSDFLSKREIKKVIFSIACGFIAAIFASATMGSDNNKLAIIICSSVAAVSYFWISNKLFLNSVGL